MSSRVHSQIRLMISAAVLETNGFFPSFAIDMMLAAPMYVQVPLAPAEGLLLVNAGLIRLYRPGNQVVRPLTIHPSIILTILSRHEHSIDSLRAI